MRQEASTLVDEEEEVEETDDLTVAEPPADIAETAVDDDELLGSNVELLVSAEVGATNGVGEVEVAGEAVEVVLSFESEVGRVAIEDDSTEVDVDSADK